MQFLLHVADEFRFFPKWATRHFGTTSRAYYVYSHIPLIVGIVAISFAAMNAERASIWIFLSTVTQCILFTNGLFHLATTILFREYSPGVVTGTFLFFPSTYLLLRETSEHGFLSSSSLMLAGLCGIVFGAAIVASLWLDMDFDWKLKRIG